MQCMLESFQACLCRSCAVEVGKYYRSGSSLAAFSGAKPWTLNFMTTD